MFWGNGDSSQLDDQQKSTLADLRRMVETGHIIALSTEQANSVIRALEWYEMWESTFKLFGSIRNTALLLGFLLTLWTVTEGTILDAIKGIFK